MILSSNGEQVITTSGAISSHMEECRAIAEIESGESVENSLFAAPDGETHVKPRVILFNGDPWADVVTKEGDSKGDKETKDIEEEEGKKEGREKNQEEGMGRKYEDRGKDEDRPQVLGLSTDAASTGTLLAARASAGLLLLNAFKCSSDEGKCNEETIKQK